MRLTAGSAAVACVANFSIEPRVDYRVGLPWSGKWMTLTNTDSADFAGGGHGPAAAVQATDGEWQRQPASVVLALPALTVVLLGSVRPL